MYSYFIEARNLFNQNKYQESLKVLEEGLNIEPQNTSLLGFKALCKFKMRMYSEAELLIKETLKIDPNNDFAYYVWGSMEMELDRFPVAKEKINSAIDINPLNSEYYGVLALIMYNNHENLEEIRKVTRMGLNFDPENNVCQNVLAMAEMRAGKRKLAANILDIHLEKDPENALSLANQGWNYLHLRDFDKSKSYFTKALKLDPSNNWALYGLLTATKTKIPLYKYWLSFFLKFANWPPEKRLKIFFGSLLVLGLGSFVPGIPGLVFSVAFAIYALSIYIIWSLGAGLNLGLGFFSYSGRFLKKSDKLQYAVTTLFSATTLGFLASYLAFGQSWLGYSALVSFILSLPASVVVQENHRLPKWLAASFVAVMGILGVSVCYLAFLQKDVSKGMQIFTLAALGFSLSTFIWKKKKR